jgi:DNA-binding MarR family transcriptional regulator
MENKELRIQLREAYMKVFHQIKKFQRIPVHYGAEKPLYISELAILEVIGYAPGINMTGIAEKHGITKGAASQAVTKLEQKGFLVRCKKEHNKKEVSLKLTMEGEAAFYTFKSFEAQFGKEMFSALDGMTDNQIEALVKFFIALDQAYNRLFSLMAKKNNVRAHF